MEILPGMEYFFNENTSTTNLNDLWSSTNNAQLSFTPSGNNEDWLVFTTSQIDPVDNFAISSTRLQSTGTVSSTNLEYHQLHEDLTNDLHIQTLAKVFTLNSEPQIFTSQSKQSFSGTGALRQYNAIFALNLEKFADHSASFTSAEINTNNNDFSWFSSPTEMASVTITPSTTANVWSFGSFVDDTGGTQTSLGARLQIDDADQPPTQTSDNYDQIVAWGTDDEYTWTLQSVESMSAAPHKVDVDFIKFDSTLRAEDRLVYAVVLETDGTPQNNPPMALDDIFTVSNNSTQIFNVSLNDTDTDDGLDLASIVVTSGPSNGLIVINDNGTITYIHDGSSTSSDLLTYTINDNSGVTSNSASVSISIRPPDAISDLTATAISSTQINLDWTDPAFQDPEITVLGYRIDRESPVNGGFVTIVNDTGNNSTSFSDFGLTSNTEYNYQIFSLQFVDGPFIDIYQIIASNEASTVTLP